MSQKRYALPEFNTRLLKATGMPRVPIDCWTRQWNASDLDLWVLTDDGELYYFPTTMTEFTKFSTPFEVKDQESLLRRIKHAWPFAGWLYTGKANPNPDPVGTIPQRR